MPSTAHDNCLLDIAGDCRTSQTPQLAPLIDALRRRYGHALAAIVYYGSCLRSGNPHAGLVDFYVIVDRYADVHDSRAGAWFNALLPPNVYYLEVSGEGARQHATLRCKYALLSIGQLETGATRWFQSGIWGRFAQPVAIVHARDHNLRQRVQCACGEAVVSLLRRALPTMDAIIEPAAAFARALTLSYASELRVESAARSDALIDSDRPEYARRFMAAAPLLACRAAPGSTQHARNDVSAVDRAIARVSWPLRTVQGKLLSVARLIKACFTFSDAVDYAAWKIQRHTGEPITISNRLRRHPLIFGWPLLWRLYRQRKLR